MSEIQREGAPRKKLPVVQTTSSDKTVLPEVLPDPRRDRAASAPRARTLAHMQRHLALGAAVGVASISCGKSNVKDASEKRGCGKSDDGSSSGQNASSGTPPLPSTYAVVDPMPPPAHCPELAALLEVQATVRQADGGLVAVVTFPLLESRPDFKYVGDAEPFVMGGTVVGTERREDGVTVTVKVAPALSDAGVSTAAVHVSVKGMCNQGPTTLDARLAWNGPATAAVKPTVSVSQY